MIHGTLALSSVLRVVLGGARPQSKLCYCPLAVCLGACYLGRGEEALSHGDMAARLSPRDLLAQGNVGVSNNVRAAACFVTGRHAEGANFARKAVAESPNLVPAYRALTVNTALAGDAEGAKAALDNLRRLVPGVSLNLIMEIMPFVRGEDQERWIEGLSPRGPGMSCFASP